MNINDVIVRPLITEKSSNLLTTRNVYTFEVNRKADKTEIKRAIEVIFANSNAKVEKINIQNIKQKAKKLGKFEGKKAGYKKAIVYLSAGNIPIYGSQGVENNEKKSKLKIINTDKILNKRK